MFLIALGVVLGIALAFDVTTARRGAYRNASYYREASKQRRAQRVNLLHSLYERRAGTRPPTRRGR